MSFAEKFHNLIGVSDFYQAPDRLWEILFNREEREELFHSLLEIVDYDLSKDFFHQYYEEEMAERKKKKQEFTPDEISEIVNRLAQSESGEYYEIGAGTGGMLINHWDQQRKKVSPFVYSPMDYFHVVEEISDRALPFLVLNMAIRGMNGVVIHGDSLSRNCKGILFIQNYEDDTLGFSDINVLPYTEEVANEFKVQFEWVQSHKIEDQTNTKKKRKSTIGYYPEYKERSWFDSEESIDQMQELLALRQQRKDILNMVNTSNEVSQGVKDLFNIFGVGI